MTAAAAPSADQIPLPDGTAAPPRRRSRRRRVALWSGVVLLVVVLGALLAVGWYYADEILAVPAATPWAGDVAVLAVDEEAGTVTLERTDRTAEETVWGLDGQDWYAQVTDVLEDDEAAGEVVRRYAPLPDEPVVGDLVAIDGYAYPPESDGIFDFTVDDVAIPGLLGDMPAFHVAGDDDTWVILVHGRGARRGEAFRMLPTVVERGHPALVIGYRNDADAPSAPDGRYGQGWTEAEDLAAAVDWAVARGASDVVLVGFSMGGAIVGGYDRQAEDAPIRGMILDGAIVDWDYPLQAAAQERGVPTALTGVAKLVITARTGLRWGDVSLLQRADELTAPILLFHGTADATVPVEGSDLLAEARPDLVTYVRVDGAGHVQAWNADPEAYAAAVDAFLDDIGA
jgi:uncharacterized protein